MKIYHYTSIETLRMILQNKTIRFNRTDHVDDPDEIELCVSGIPFSKYIFVSCWTNDVKENIPQWSMYGNHSKGVRLCMESSHMFNDFLKTMCFEKKDFTPELIDKIFYDLGDGKWIVPFLFISSDRNKVYLPNYLFHGKINPLKSGMCIMPPTRFENFFMPVEYVDDMTNTYPNSFNIEHLDAKIYNLKYTPKIGFKKQKSWEFQREVRFIIMMMHTVPKESSKNVYSDCPNANFTEYGFAPIKEDRAELHSYDISLDNDAFNYLEVTMGPETSSHDSETVLQLLKKYAPNSTLRKSSLRTNFNRN